MLCPCGSKNEFEKCCEPYISGSEQPKTAEVLMRARFTAYAKLQMDFIESSHDPKFKDGNDMEANRKWAEQTKWLELQIISTEEGGPEDNEGVVEFKAKFDAGDGEQWHHELSHFNKRNGTWYFSDSKSPQQKTVVRDEKKVGRNDPCSCGSGKKYKKCCG
jgi:SEC-C motif-containing protein